MAVNAAAPRVTATIAARPDFITDERIEVMIVSFKINWCQVR